MISILIFIVILAVLILVHEFGHFLLAKLFKIRVDEFGIGYPPRAATLFNWRGTAFTLNWLPFGGFVKIFGENGEGADPASPEADKNFMQKPRIAQALVLIAGVSFNIIFAWLLISVGFMIGLPTSTSSVSAERANQIENPKLVITLVSADSPAEVAGLKSGDVITGVTLNAAPEKNKVVIGSPVLPSVKNLTPETVSSFIAENGEKEIKVSYARGNEVGTVVAKPDEGIIPDRKAIGISMDTVGTLSLPVHEAFWESAKTTVNLTKLVAVGLGVFVYDAIRGASDFSQVTGPVGIVGLVGDASALGFIYLLSFTAFISINLAVINLIPFPALDGGRLLFVIIEAIKRSPISPKIANAFNVVGFFLLIGLMVVVTIQDVVRLF